MDIYQQLKNQYILKKDGGGTKVAPLGFAPINGSKNKRVAPDPIQSRLTSILANINAMKCQGEHTDQVVANHCEVIDFLGNVIGELLDGQGTLRTTFRSNAIYLPDHLKQYEVFGNLKELTDQHENLNDTAIDKLEHTMKVFFRDVSVMKRRRNIAS